MAEPNLQTGPLAPDRTRDRTAVLNQLMLSAVVVALAALGVITTPFPGDIALFFLGVLSVFVMTALTLLIPWNRVAVGWMAVVPAADMLAIAVLRASSPPSGLGLLWLFPVMWLASSFGLAGLVGGVVATVVLFATVVLLDPAHHVTYSTFLLPLVLLALAASSYLTARRFAAQRSLLDKQAQVLAAALERTRRQEQEVTEVLDAVDFGVVRIDADGSTAVTNEAHGRLQRALQVGHAPAAYQDDGTTPLPPDEFPLERALRGEAFSGQLVWFGDPTGPRHVLSVTARRLTDTAGHDLGAVVVSRDVTAELAALQARDELVASVSHELRTPLTSILGYLDLVLDDPSVPVAARRSIEIAERNAERLLAIVADILAASRRPHAVTAQLPIEPADIDVRPLVRAAVESMLPRAAERRVRIDDTGVGEVWAHVDAHRLRQVLDNLIANAVKYNVDGGQVRIDAAVDGSDVCIEVTDTGVGIAEHDLQRLFQRFYRGRSVRSSGMTGTGLGLAISREIVRAHGGDITVRSEPGVGSTFTVRVPQARSVP
ncbi:sensor histidine kinase [Microbacterium luticocti]|uniref:sensor histidine kinase n=1 Tax=Microbacterium luticocti TaxID=451764 RepID=UPI00040A755E|nr:HAMP domain-containing sensor histidine kinase [Microbacterium luticocti]